MKSLDAFKEVGHYEGILETLLTLYSQGNNRRPEDRVDDRRIFDEMVKVMSSDPKKTSISPYSSTDRVKMKWPRKYEVAALNFNGIFQEKSQGTCFVCVNEDLKECVTTKAHPKSVSKSSF